MAKPKSEVESFDPFGFIIDLREIYGVSGFELKVFPCAWDQFDGNFYFPIK